MNKSNGSKDRSDPFLKRFFVKAYFQNWLFAVILKTFTDLILGFLLVFTLIGIGFLLGKISFFSEAKLLSSIVIKSSVVLAYCYLSAIFVSVAIRIFYLIKSDISAFKKANKNEAKCPADKPEIKKEGKK